MDVGAIQNAMVGMMLIDMWSAGMDKMIKANHSQHGDPLVAAAFAAFEQYIGTVETQHAGQIAGLATYALTPKGNGVINTQQMAPFLALNVMA